tara:strand:- start:70 stop:357 length:288 start_codon:yes stop_codon:yes gene_type:complete
MYFVTMSNNQITNPCISVCKTDPISGYCYGCGRNSEDKKNWNNPNISEGWKIENLIIIRSRLEGWQKNAFDRSYEHKKKTGNSLLKQIIIDQKKL